MKYMFFLFLSLLMILFVYSSEIYFMPNFNHKPDKWHLLAPMFCFGVLLIFQMVWSIIDLVKGKKTFLGRLILTTVSVFLFVILNNPKGNSQNIGYVGLVIIAIISLVLFAFEKKKRSR